MVYTDTTSGDEGGIQVGYNGVSGTLKLAISTLAHNYADANGGGIYVQSGEVDLTNVTIAKNNADSNELSGDSWGGILVDRVQPTHLYMVNKLVANNKLGDGSKSDCDGTIISGGTNLVRFADGCSGFIGSDLVGTSGVLVNAYLKPLQDRGDYTWLIPLQVNSSAVDAGNQSVCNATPVNGLDQRVYSHIEIDGNEDGGTDGDNCDIGAFELNAAPD